MRIGSLDTRDRVVVVAEIGNNHEGDVAVARALVESAADAGADAVKLQTFLTDRLVRRQERERFERLEQFRLEPDAVAELAELARSRGLAFMSTPFDLDSAALLEPLVDAFKIASGDNTFWPLIERVAASGRPVIVSAGFVESEEIARTVETIRSTPGFGGELAVLHCVSLYPAPPETAGLRTIVALREQLDCEIGYSDHTLGIDAALLAVPLGARIVEKHFTLDKAQSDFRDHRLSADPAELRTLVERVRLAEALLAPPDRSLEREAEQALRRSVVPVRDLEAGHRLASEDITWVRPGGGIPPGGEAALLGRALVRSVRAGEQLAESDVA